MDYLRTETRELPTGAAADLSAELGWANLSVAGADTDRVTVQIVARISEQSEEAADQIWASVLEGVRHHDRAVEIVTARVPSITVAGPWFLFNRGLKLDYAVTVPRATGCRISSRSGRVELARVAGPVEISGRSGRVIVRGVQGDVTVECRSGSIDVEEVGGAARVTGHSGKVSLRDIGGNVEATTNSGTIQTTNIGGRLEARTQSGRIEATRVAGTVFAKAASGRITVVEPGDEVRAGAASGPLEVRGAVRGDYDLRTASGSVVLEVDPRVPFRISAETVSGKIRSDLDTRGDALPPADAPLVTIRAVSGAIRIGRYVAG